MYVWGILGWNWLSIVLVCNFRDLMRCWYGRREGNPATWPIAQLPAAPLESFHTDEAVRSLVLRFSGRTPFVLAIVNLSHVALLGEGGVTIKDARRVCFELRYRPLRSLRVLSKRYEAVRLQGYV
jgi:hypothetical protein